MSMYVIRWEYSIAKHTDIKELYCKKSPRWCTGG